MTDSRGLIDHILDETHELVRDHQTVLADFAARVEPHANELTEAWARAYQEVAARQPHSADAIASGSIDELARSFIGELRQGHPRESLARLAEWIQRLALAGMSYDLVVRLVHEYQRATVPLATRAYSSGPELPLVLDALDDLFSAAATLVGGAFIEAAQTRAIGGARWHVLGQLSGGAAHALNNLLTAILGRTQLLLEHTSGDQLRAELREIHDTAAMGARVVRRLQDYARTDSREKPLGTDVNLLLRDAAEITRFLWRDQAEASGIVIDVVKDLAEVPSVLVRPIRMLQVLVALVLNAIDAMPEGGLITLRSERKGNSVLVSVIDNGEGMPEGVRARVFDPFFTTRKSPHLGLGLSAAAQIVAEHNGKLAVESAPGRGATFTLLLPMGQGVAERKQSVPPTAARSANILAIDNEPAVRDLLARLLGLHGHQVVAAESGSEGIAAFKKEKFDLVITDLGMPGMSGWDVAREIKKQSPHTLVALTTGWPVDLEPKELKEKGVDRVVNKPVDVPQLLALIDEAIALGDKR